MTDVSILLPTITADCNAGVPGVTVLNTADPGT